MKSEQATFLESLPRHLTYKPVDTVTIGTRQIGKGCPVYIIAEVSANHRGDIEIAKRAIQQAAQAGADAVKFQHLTATKIAADTVRTDEWNGKPIGTFSDFYKSAELPNDWTPALIACAQEAGIEFLSTPFDTDAVEVLDKAGVAAYKVASYELTDDVLVRCVARKGKPVIISTGMAYLEEVAHAVRVIQEEGNTQIIILHCVSMYPPKEPADLNLRAIETLQRALRLPVGYSDHSAPPYVAAPLAAVVLGACVIEKHITDSREVEGNDAPNSVTPQEFANMVREIRLAEEHLCGNGIKQPVSRGEHTLGEDEIADRYARRCVYASRDIAAGEVLEESAYITLRPWALGGILPHDLHLFVGKKLRRPVVARQPLTLSDFMG